MEAMVFASAGPVSPRALTALLPDGADPEPVVAALRARYAGRGVELVEVAGGWQFRTAPDLAARCVAWCRCRAGCRAWRWRRWRSSPTTSR